jgi:hypothetical protein
VHALLSLRTGSNSFDCGSLDTFTSLTLSNVSPRLDLHPASPDLLKDMEVYRPALLCGAENPDNQRYLLVTTHRNYNRSIQHLSTRSQDHPNTHALLEYLTPRGPRYRLP